MQLLKFCKPALFSLFCTAFAHADADSAPANRTEAKPAQVKSETAIHYRQSLFRVILWNFLPMADMTKGKTAFDAKEFSRRAGRVAALAPQLIEGFPQGSDSGTQTDAKAEIWANFDDFQTKMNALVDASRILSETAKTDDEAKMKAQFQKTAGTCKSCHEKYRAD